MTGIVGITHRPKGAANASYNNLAKTCVVIGVGRGLPYKAGRKTCDTGPHSWRRHTECVARQYDLQQIRVSGQS